MKVNKNVNNVKKKRQIPKNQYKNNTMKFCASPNFQRHTS